MLARFFWGMVLYSSVFTRGFPLGQKAPNGGGYSIPGRRDVLDLIHDRSRMTVDPRIPTIPERSMPGFHRPGRHCLHQERNAVRCPASPMKGELHPTKNRS